MIKGPAVANRLSARETEERGTNNEMHAPIKKNNDIRIKFV